MSTRKTERQINKQLIELRELADSQWIEALEHESLGEDRLANSYYKKAFASYQSCLKLLAGIKNYASNYEFFYFTFKYIGNAYFEQSKGDVQIISTSVLCYENALAIAKMMNKLPESEFDINLLSLKLDDTKDYIESLASNESDEDISSSEKEQTTTMEIDSDEVFSDDIEDFNDEISNLLTMNSGIFESGSSSYETNFHNSTVHFDGEKQSLAHIDIDFDDMLEPTRKKSEPKQNGVKRSKTEDQLHCAQNCAPKRTKKEDDLSDAELIIKFGYDSSETDIAQSLLEIASTMQRSSSFGK